METMWSGWVIVLLIILARVVDVSLGTLRVVFVSRGMKWLAPVTGFFEVLVWITAIAQIMRNLDSWVTYVAYAFGYALGTFIGIQVEERLAFGTVLLRIVPQADATLLADRLRERGYRVTSLAAEGVRGPVTVLFSVLRRAQLPVALGLVKAFNPRAFYTIEDVRSASSSGLPPSTENDILRRLFSLRPGK